MSKLVIKVEFLAGSHVKKVAEEMVALRQRLGVNIAGSFNGIHLYVGRATKTAEEIEQDYDREIRG